MNIVDIEKVTASALLLGMFNPVGGECKWYKGSAVPQNKMPVATVVQRAIENHFHLLKIGIADSPPIFFFAKGEQ